MAGWPLSSAGARPGRPPSRTDHPVPQHPAPARPGPTPVLPGGAAVRPFGKSQWRTVSKHGAGAGAVLRGCGLSNMGLRLRVEEAQGKGADGPVQGGFVILDAGRNTHTDALLPLLGRPTDARDVL